MITTVFALAALNLAVGNPILAFCLAVAATTMLAVSTPDEDETEEQEC